MNPTQFDHTRVSDAWLATFPTPKEVRSARRRLHAKAAVIGLLLAVSYYVLVMSDTIAPGRIVAATVLIVALIALATSVMHDANHGAFSTHRWINRALSYTSDLLGSSSWLWRIQHNQLHHGNANVVGFDADIELAPWARLEPTQPWRPRYRWQHLYIWPLYGFMTTKNLIVSDWLSLIQGRIGGQPLKRRVTPHVVTEVLVGKFAHLTWAVVVPLLFNPWRYVLAFYLVCSWTVGLALSLIFQLAHCVEAAETPGRDAPRRGHDFASHQLRTTVDIASPTPVIGHVFRWVAGGLDHQIEHHLGPALPHTIYPSIAARFRGSCAVHGIDYHLHPSITAALRSHARWLRAMGQP